MGSGTLFKFFKLFVVFVMVFGNLMQAQNLVRAEDEPGAEPAPAESSQASSGDSSDSGGGDAAPVEQHASEEAGDAGTQDEAPVETSEGNPDDGETPAEEPQVEAPQEEAANPASEEVEESSAPAEESGSPEQESAPAPETGDSSAGPVEVAAEDVAILEETVQSLIENDQVLVNEDGETIPLGSQEAADVITSDDPWYYDTRDHKTYGYSTSGSCPNFVNVCTKTSTPFSTAVSNAPSGATIYVEGSSSGSGTRYDEDVIVNTANLIIQAVIRSGNSVNYSSGNVSVRSITLNYALANAIRILADTVNVGNDSVSLQQAIDLVKSGGTVNVAAGNYAGNVEITKSLTIQGNTGTSNPGAGSSAPVVSSSTGSGNYGFRVDASGVTIRGFKFTGNYYGVRVAASNARIEQSAFWGNYAGVYVENDVENTVATYNAFLGNTRAAIINAYAPTGTGDSRKLVDASNNYWGTSNGPKRTTNSNGYYDGVYTHTRDRWATDSQTGSTYGDWVEGYVKFQSPAAQYDSIIVDADGDGIADDSDNCPGVSNADQADNDGDGAGNACDATPNGDDDSDGVDNLSDNCPSVSNADQADNDGDGAGNACDATPNGDDDSDGVDNLSDNCPSVSNADQADNDGDGAGNACDATPNGDDDGDGVDNLSDNCPGVSNADQADNDGDGAGNACDATPNGDDDGDGVDNNSDNCQGVSNPDQSDMDGDGAGDVCDATPNGDDDGDGVDNNSDNCRGVSNPDQSDMDGDNAGDACDLTPNGDDDGDGVDNLSDNCSSVSNADQADNDNDGAGNACDATPNGDDDGDGVDNQTDNCLTVANPDQKDSDKDGVGNACEPPVSISSGTVIGGLDATSYFVPVTGARQYPLGCEYTCSTFTLPNGDQVQLCSLCGNLVTFGQVGSTEMPGALGSGVSFVSALNVELLALDGSPLETAPEGSSLTVTFVVPAAFQGKSLSVMHWDAGQNGGVGSWTEATCQASGSTCTMLVGKVQHGEQETDGVLTDGLFVLVAK